MRANDVAKKLMAPPTDSLPVDPGPSWQTIADIGAMRNYADGLPLITTGFSTLDTILVGGFRAESTYVLAGRTSDGKSTLGLNIARRSALSGNCVLVLKLEESPREALYRIHAAAAQVPLINLLDGVKSVTAADRDKLRDGWDLIRELPIRISDSRNIDAIERISQEHAEHDGKLIIVDQLSMVDAPNTTIGYERATAISNRFRHLARKLGMPIVIIAQVNREAAKKKKEHLGVNDLRDSGAIENDASAVIIIDRIRKPDGPPCRGEEIMRYLQIVVPKNRYGPKIEDAPAEMLWWPRLCRVEDKPCRVEKRKA